MLFKILKLFFGDHEDEKTSLQIIRGSAKRFFTLEVIKIVDMKNDPSSGFYMALYYITHFVIVFPMLLEAFSPVIHHFRIELVPSALEFYWKNIFNQVKNFHYQVTPSMWSFSIPEVVVNGYLLMVSGYATFNKVTKLSIYFRRESTRAGHILVRRFWMTWGVIALFTTWVTEWSKFPENLNLITFGVSGVFLSGETIESYIANKFPSQYSKATGITPPSGDKE